MTMTKERDRWAERLMTLLGALWLGLFPLWQDGSYTRITRAKWRGMLGLSSVTAVIVLAVMIALLVKRQGKKLRFHPAQVLALVYLGWLTVTAFCGSFADSVNSSGQLAAFMGARRYEGLAGQAVYIGLFLLMSLYPARLRAVMNAAALGMLIYIGIVALQYMGRNPFDLFPEGMNVRTTNEFQGPIGNIDMVSGYLCLIVPVLLFSFAERGTGALCLLAGCAGTLLMLLIQVQSGIIALAAALAALALLMLMRPETRARGGIALACALAMLSLRLLIGLPWHDGTKEILFPYAAAKWKFIPLILGAVIVLATRWRGKAVRGRWVLALLVLGAAAGAAVVLLGTFPEGSALWELREVLGGRGQDGFGSERLGIWRMTLEMARKNLVFGTGPDTFWYAMAQHQADTAQSLTQRFDNPHNMLLAVLSGSGVPALALYLALIASAVVMCLRASRREPWSLALLAGLITYQLQGLFTFSVCIVSPMFWVLFGMTAARTCRQEEGFYDRECDAPPEVGQGDPAQSAGAAGDCADRGAAGAAGECDPDADGQQSD